MNDPDTVPNERRATPWLGIGIALLILILGLVFFFAAEGRLQHRHLYYGTHPPTPPPPTTPVP